MLNYTEAARFRWTQTRSVRFDAPLTRLPARCYKRMLRAVACSLNPCLHAERHKFSDAAKSALLLILICRAVEARFGPA